MNIIYFFLVIPGFGIERKELWIFDYWFWQGCSSYLDELYTSTDAIVHDIVLLFNKQANYWIGLSIIFVAFDSLNQESMKTDPKWADFL